MFRSGILAEFPKANGSRREYHISEGGHTWIDWRPSLQDVSRLLFPQDGE